MRIFLAAFLLAGCTTSGTPFAPPAPAPSTGPRPVTVISDADNPPPTAMSRFNVCMDAAGKVTSVKLIESSGNAYNDNAAKQALEESTPAGVKPGECRDLNIAWRVESSPR